MQAAKIAKQGPSYHDVVEMRHYKVGVTHMHVNRKRCQKKSGHTANCEQRDEGERVEHRRVIRDRCLVKRCSAIEDFYRGRDRDGEAQERKDHARVNRLAGDEQVVTPYEKTKHGDCQTREGDKLVAKN